MRDNRTTPLRLPRELDMEIVDGELVPRDALDQPLGDASDED